MLVDTKTKLSGALFAAFLRDATDVGVSRPWPQTRPDWRVMRFTKGEEKYLAAYDMAQETALLFVRTGDDDSLVEAAT